MGGGVTGKEGGETVFRLRNKNIIVKIQIKKKKMRFLCFNIFFNMLALFDSFCCFSPLTWTGFP